MMHRIFFSTSALVSALLSQIAMAQEPGAPQDPGTPQETGSPLVTMEIHNAIALPLKRNPDGSLEALGQGIRPDAASVWLHVKGKTSCYFLYDEHYYETKTTTGKDFNSPPVNVASLKLRFRVGGDTGDQTCSSTYICAKTIKEYNLYCRTPRCVSATATDTDGISWSTSQHCW